MFRKRVVPHAVVWLDYDLFALHVPSLEVPIRPHIKLIVSQLGLGVLLEQVHTTHVLAFGSLDARMQAVHALMNS